MLGLGVISHYLRHELLQIVGSSLADGINMVDQPGHAESAQFFIKEFHSKLAWMVVCRCSIDHVEYDLCNNSHCTRHTCKQRHIFNDGEPDSPFGVFGQFDDGWQQGL